MSGIRTLIGESGGKEKTKKKRRRGEDGDRGK
jgi:hypothetical protein